MILSFERKRSDAAAGGQNLAISRRTAQPSPYAKVSVLVESVYNGPNNKSLGLCKVGDIIEVAPGPYADSLIADGLVEPVTDTAPAAAAFPEPSSVPDTEFMDDKDDEFDLAEAEADEWPELDDEDEDDVGPPPDAVGASLDDAFVDEPELDAPWLPLMDAEISEIQAKNLYDAGLETAADIVASYVTRGYEEITGVKQIGVTTARKILLWAGVDEDDLD